MACRAFGIEGKRIDFGKEAEVPMRELATELLEFVDDVVDDLGSRSAVEYVHTILREGTSAERQLRVLSGNRRPQSGRAAPGRRNPWGRHPAESVIRTCDKLNEPVVRGPEPRSLVS